MNFERDGDTLIFKLLVNGHAAPVDQWSSHHNIGVDTLSAWIDQDTSEAKISSEGKAVRVTINKVMKALAEDDGSLRESLGLPGIFPGVLKLADEGMLDDTRYSIKHQWLKPNGIPFTAVTEDKCFVRAGGKDYMLTGHAWSVLQEVQRINEKNATLGPSDKLVHLNTIQSLLKYLPADARSQIQADGRIRHVRLYYADAFHIEAETTSDGYNVLPILKRIDHSPYTDTEVVFSDLLTRADLELFQDHFKQSAVARQHYTLETGRYLIISKKVHRALELIHKIRNESPANRLQFLQNPRKAFEEKLGEEFSGDILDAIFSDRVTGFGEKQKLIIPWIKIEGQVWWPAEDTVDKAPWPRGMDIDDKKVTFGTPKELEDFETTLINVLSEPNPLPIIYKGIEIPVSVKTLEVVRSIKPSAAPTEPGRSAPQREDIVQDIRTKPMVFYVKGNLDKDEYQACLTPRKLPEFSWPVSVKSAPKKHQEEGVAWLAQHYRAGTRGVLLADDMGLGKTFQVLAFLSWLREQIDQHRVKDLPLLIVAPTGLLENWITKEHDVHLYTPGLGNPLRAYGKWLKSVQKDWNLRDAKWILTTYETLANYQSEFGRQSYAAVVFDEMQKVKNPDTLATIASKALKADFWIGMTGTPVENRLGDLWCLMDTLVPGLLGNIKDFSHRYEKAVTSKPPNESELSRLNYRIRKESHSPDAPAIMLRRMKSEVLSDIPRKNIHTISHPMPQKQASVYSSILEIAREKKGEPGAALQALQAMRSLSLHPDYKTPVIHDGDNAFINASARLVGLFEQLDRIAAKDEKALIFLEPQTWHRTDALPALIQRRYKLRNRPLVIMGDVKGSERQNRVNQFQSDPDHFDVMLLSPKAGGVGLTLTAANHVFHLTRWWNPAVEDQATDRIYRIGQKKEVHVYCPLAIHPALGESSFDLVLDKLLERKRKLSERVLWPPAGSPADFDFLTEEAIWGKRGDSDALTYEDVLAMEPLQFEDHVINTVQRSLPWLRVERTIQSHDGGADVVIKSNDGTIVGIMQCKHTGSRDSTPSTSGDLCRSLDYYRTEKPWLIGVSTAGTLQRRDYDWAKTYPKSILITGADSIHCESAIDRLRA